MTPKRTVCLVLVALVLVAMMGMKVFAAGAWYICDVKSAGPIATAHNYGTRIFLTDTAKSPAFQNQEFQVPLARSKEFLAVALDAIDQRKKVKVYVNDSGAGAIPTVFALYLEAQ